MEESFKEPLVSFDQTISEIPDVAECILNALKIQFNNLEHVSPITHEIERFSFFIGKKRYLLQYSFGRNSAINRESIFLINKKHLLQAPSITFSGEYDFFGELVTYNIITYDFAENLFENLGFLNFGLDSISRALAQLSFERLGGQSTEEYVDNLQEFWRTVKTFTSHYSFQPLHQIVESLLNDISQTKFKSNHICHGDLTPHNMIVLGDQCKLINWQNCVRIDHFYDFCCFALNCGFDLEFAIKFYIASGFKKPTARKINSLWTFAQKVTLVRAICQYCYWTYSRQKSDGFVAFCAASYIEKISNQTSFLSKIEKDFLLKLVLESFFQEKLPHTL